MSETNDTKEKTGLIFRPWNKTLSTTEKKSAKKCQSNDDIL